MEEENKTIKQEKNKKSTKRKSVGFVIVLLIVVAIGVLFLGKVVFHKANTSETKKGEKEESTEIEENNKEEKELNDTNSCDDILFQTNIYSTMYYLLGGNPKEMIENCQFKLLNKKSYVEMGRTFNNGKLLHTKYTPDMEGIALGIGFELRGEPLSYDAVSKEFIELLKNNAGVSDPTFYSVSYDKINNIYKTLYGEDMEKRNSISFCVGPVEYDSNSDSFIYANIYSCENSENPKNEYLYSYVNRIEEEGNEVNAYVNVARSDESANLYDGFFDKTIILSNINYTTFKMTENNAKLFKEYKYTFKKDEKGNNYFVSFE